MAKQWYVIHTQSGCEEKVKLNLERTIKQAKLEEQIDEVLIPTEEVVEMRKGEKKVSRKKFFPGYVLIHMEMEEAAWKTVTRVPGITSFVGTGAKPVALPEQEVKTILIQMGKIEGKARPPRPKQTFKEGQNVRITDGPFENFIGKVTEVSEERGRLKVMVTIFDRQTPVELDFLQVGKP